MLKTKKIDDESDSTQLNQTLETDPASLLPTQSSGQPPRSVLPAKRVEAGLLAHSKATALEVLESWLARSSRSAAIASRRFSIWAIRPTGVKRNHVGHANCNISTAFPVASFSLTNASCWHDRMDAVLDPFHWQIGESGLGLPAIACC